jgi:hypothetical protein
MYHPYYNTDLTHQYETYTKIITNYLDLCKSFSKQQRFPLYPNSSKPLSNKPTTNYYQAPVRTNESYEIGKEIGSGVCANLTYDLYKG